MLSKEYAYRMLLPSGSKCVDSARSGGLEDHNDVTMLSNMCLGEIQKAWPWFNGMEALKGDQWNNLDTQKTTS